VIAKPTRVALRLLPPHVKPILQRVARIAGVPIGEALRAASEQRALDGRTAFTVRGPGGIDATYIPEGARYR